MCHSTVYSLNNHYSIMNSPISLKASLCTPTTTTGRSLYTLPCISINWASLILSPGHLDLEGTQRKEVVEVSCLEGSPTHSCNRHPGSFSSKSYTVSFQRILCCLIREVCCLQAENPHAVTPVSLSSPFQRMAPPNPSLSSLT